LEEAHPACACDCDRERIEASLIALGREELEDMIEKDGGAELTCHFCLKKYRFNAAELRRLLIQASC
jgi:Disulfide bond chaperones of the HSP33 family